MLAAGNLGIGRLQCFDMVRRRAQSTVRWVAGSAVVAALALAAYVLVPYFTRPVVTVTEPVEAPVVQAFYATGTLQPDREFPIKSNVEGTLTEVLVDKGDHVRQGQRLAFVVVEEYQFRYKQALAELELKRQLADERTSPTLRELDDRLKAVNEQLEIAQRELARVQDLSRRGAAASVVDVDRASDRVQELLNAAALLRGQRATRKLELDRDVAVAQANLDTAQWNLDQQTIRSPVDGVVLDRPTPLGTRVRENDQLMTVADVAPANLVMRAQVDEEDKTLVRLDPPQTVRMTLYSYPGTVFSGTVKRVYPQADPDRRTFEVDVQMSKPDPGFSAGMTGELAFVIAEKAKATVVPSQAYQGGAIWVVRDGQLVRTDAQVGLRSIERIEVLSGLQNGDQIVISPVQALRPGERVRARYMDPLAAANLNKKETEEAFRGFN